jgi:2,4-dienoyl-CoA reductase-like NADH-dependent reductase (Old Yellow Enzyme family)
VTLRPAARQHSEFPLNAMTKNHHLAVFLTTTGLFAPYRMGTITLRIRFVMHPMTRCRADA